MDDLRVIHLKRLLTLDAGEILGKALDVSTQIGAELLD